MANDEKGMDPWRIGILVLIIGAFALAFWFMSQIVDARFNSLEGQLRSTSDSLSQQISVNRSLIIETSHCSAAEQPAPAAAAEEASAEGEATEGEAAEGEAEGEEAEEGGGEE